MFGLRFVKLNSKYKCLIAKFSSLNTICAKLFKSFNDDSEVREYCNMIFEIIYIYINKRNMLNKL